MPVNIKRDEYFVICADRGYDFAVKNGIVPDLILGDMDSVSEKNLYSSNVMVYPTEKDDTDTSIAVKTALERGYKDIQIFSGTGDRIDHTFGNIQLLKLIAKNGASGIIHGTGTRIQVICNNTIIIKNDGYYNFFSVLSLDNECVVSITNAKYPLEMRTLTNEFPLGISNEYGNENYAKITSHQGYALIVEVK